MTTNRRKRKPQATRSAPPPGHRVLAVNRADLARLLGRSRSTITELFQGRLAPAALSYGQVDAAHPVVRLYAKERGINLKAALLTHEFCELPEPKLMMTDEGATADELARCAGVSVAEARAALEGPLAAAVIPSHHLAVADFARLAGTSTDEIEAAASDALAPAILPCGRLDLGHDAALEFMAKHPFRRDRKGKIIEADIPEGIVSPAAVGDMIDIDHPFSRAFIARCDGVVPAVGAPL